MITDDDAAPTLTIADGINLEGDDITFTLTLSNPSSTDVIIDVSTATGTADNGDFTGVTNSIIILAGSVSQSISIETINDLIDEESEDFNLLANVTSANTANSSASAIGTILDNDFTTQEDTLLSTAIDADEIYGVGANYVYNNDIDQGGTITLNSDGSFDYQPAGDFVGSETFSYTVTDINGIVHTQNVTLLVNPVDDAKNDDFITDEDTELNADVSANDTFSATANYSYNSDAAHGEVVMNTDGTFTYNPDPDFAGSDNFTYTVTDINGSTEIRTVEVVVNALDDALDDNYTINEDEVLNANVADNDIFKADANYVYDANAAHGSVTMNIDGAFIYTPDADFVGIDSFTYTVTDINGATEKKTVTISVTAVDDVVDDEFTIDEDTVLSGDASTNDDFNAGANYLYDGNVTSGSVTMNVDGAFEYVPNPDFNGTDSFTYTVTDVNGATETGTVTVNVSAKEDAEDNSYTIAEDNQLDADVSLNDTFSAEAVYTENGNAAHGTVVMDGDGKFTYTPNDDFNGTDTFNYTVTDINGEEEVQLVTINITESQDAFDDNFTVNEDNVLSDDVSLNDTFSATASYSYNDNASQGTVTMNTDGTFVYTPDADYNGADSFTYTVTDINGLNETRTVDIDVIGQVDAVDDSFTVAEDLVLNEDVSTNDTFDAGATYAYNADADHGTVIMNADGTFSFTPDADFNGTDSFTYTVTDSFNTKETRTVTINVDAIDDAVDDSFITDEDTVLSADVSENDTFSAVATYVYDNNATNGTVSMNADGTFTYTPNSDFNGTDSFTYTVTDSNGEVETRTVSLNVGATDDAADDDFITEEDTTLTADVSANDTFVTAVTYIYNDNATHGTVSMNPDGTFEYEPNADYNGLDTFTYTVTDTQGASETRNVTVTISATTDAADDNYTTDEDTFLNADVSGNDTFNAAATYAYNADVNDGTVSMNADGTFTYIPDADFNGTDTFTYTVTDVNGTDEIHTVSIVVGATDDAADDDYLTEEDTQLSADVSENDTFSGAATYSYNDDIGNGSLVMEADGTFIYTPNSDFNGIDIFTYTVADAYGGTETRTVTITVDLAEDALDDNFLTEEDTVLSADVSLNDTFSGNATYVYNDDVNDGTISMNADGTFDYVPDADFNGISTFTYTVTDENGDVETRAVTISVSATADARDDDFLTEEDTTLTADVSENDTFSAAANYVYNNDAANGTVTMNNDGTFDYVPNADFNGTEIFTYTVTDVNGKTETRTVTVTVGNAEDASDDDFVTGEDTLLNADVSENDTFSTTATYVYNDDANNGTVVMNADGIFTYVPDADFNGSETFTYSVTDANGDEETKTVTIIVNAAEDAADDFFNTDEEAELTADVSENDTYAGTATYTFNGDAVNGTVVMSADGTFTYTPDADYNGADTFTYTVTDAYGDTETKTVTVNVGAEDDAADDAFVTDEDTVLNNDVSANDTFTGTTTYVYNNDVIHGTVTMNADGTFEYIPNGDYNGTDTFTYTVTDINGQQETKTVTITVNGVNDAANDDYNTDEDVAINADVSINDTFSAEANYSYNNDAANGTVTMNADGTFNYTPNADFNGTETFSYTVIDVNGVSETETVTVTITVGAVDDAADDEFVTDEDVALNADVSVNDTFSAEANYSYNNDAANGTVTMNTDGTFLYTPNTDYNGTDTFTYSVTDINGNVETKTVTILVSASDDAADDEFVTNEDTQISADVSENDTFSTGAAYAYNNDAVNGTVTMNTDGTFDYIPNADFNGTETFTYTVTDVNGVTEVRTVTISVNAVDDASDDDFVIDEDGLLSGDVAENDTYAGATTYVYNDDADNGTVAMNPDGTFIYTPNPDYSGTDTFTYSVIDSNGDVEVRSVTINVGESSDASDDDYVTDEDTFISADVSDNDTFTTSVTYAYNNDVANGTVVMNADGSFTYTPNADFNGTETFTYTVTDGNGNAEVRTVTVIVNPTADGVNDNYIIDEDNVLSADASENDTFSAAVTYAYNNDVANGTVVMNVDGTFDYTPNADFAGTDTFTYTVTDVYGDTEIITVTIAVSPAEDALDDSFVTSEDTLLNADVSENDTFSAEANYSYNNDVNNGTVVMNANGTFSYTPNADFTGTDTFTYTVTDINGLTETKTVTINVNNVEDAVDDEFITEEDIAINGDVAANDNFSENATYTFNDDATNGTVTMNADGIFDYVPAADFNGIDSFTYTVTDVYEITEVRTVTITVVPVEDAHDDSYETEEDTEITADVSENDTYTGTAVYVYNNDAVNGTVDMNPDGTFNYLPNVDFNGMDSFTYTVTDVNGQTETRTVTIMVNGQNDEPVAQDDNNTTDEDVTLTVSAIDGLLSNDTDTESPTLSITRFTVEGIANNPGSTAILAEGELTINSDGSYTFVPAANYNGSVPLITYTITDGNGGTASANLNLTINPVNDLPLAVDDTVELIKNTSAEVIEILVNDDFGGDGPSNGSVILSAPALNGSASVNDNGTPNDPTDDYVVYTPNTGYVGTDEIKYVITDANGDVSEASVLLTILNNELSITKEDIFVDENENGIYEAGESIAYTFTVTNGGETTLTNVTVSDALVNVVGGPILTLEPGAVNSTTFKAVYILKQEDIELGSFANTATVSATDPNGNTISSVSDDAADATDEDSDGDGLPDDATVTVIPEAPGLHLTKFGVWDDNNSDGISQVGETIHYTFELTNTGNVIVKDIAINDPLVNVNGAPITLAPGEYDNTTFTAVYVLTQDDVDAGEVNNQANANGATNKGTIVSESSDDPSTTVENDQTVTALTRIPELSFFKTAVFRDENGDGFVQAGETIDYIFEILNTGNTTITDLTVSDPKLTVIGGPLASLLPGEIDRDTFSGSYVIKQEDIDSGSFSNQAVVSGVDSSGATVIDVSDVSDDPNNHDNVDLDGDGDPDDPTVLGIDSDPALTISKSDLFNDENNDGIFQAGETIDYTFVVENVGNVTLTDIVVNDTLVNVSDASITLAPGQKATDHFTATYTLTQADIDSGSVSNTAFAEANDPKGNKLEVRSDDPDNMINADNDGDGNPDDPTVTLVPEAAMIVVAKTDTFNDENGNGIYEAGESITYNFAVTNTGNVTIADVSITDAQANVNGGPIDLAPGATDATTFEAVYVLIQTDIDAGQVANTATVSGKSPAGIDVSSKSDDPDNTDDNDSDGDGNPDDVTITTVSAQGEILVTKTDTFNDENGNGIYESGESISYTFAVTNIGNVTLSNITISDAITSVDGGPVTLAPGAVDATSFTADYVITQDDIDAGQVVNTATANAEQPDGIKVSVKSDDPDNTDDNDSDGDGNPDDVTITTVSAQGKILVTKTDTFNDENGNGIYEAGESITYNFVVTNTGNVTLTDISIADALTTVSGGPIDLAPGAIDATTFEAVYVLTQADIDSGQVSNTATVSAESPTGVDVSSKSDDPDNTDDNDSDGDGNPDDITVTRFEGQSGILVTKTDTFNDENGNGIYESGESITYIFAVTNTGNVTLTDVSIDDALANVNGGPITLAPGSVDATTFTADYVITQADIDSGQVSNTATVSGKSPAGVDVSSKSDDPDNTDDNDSDGDGNPDDITVTRFEGQSGILVTKTDTFNDENGNGIYESGESITYIFAVTNTGNVTLTDVSIDDALANVNGGPITLAPGSVDATTFTADYVITQADIDSGQVSNTATVSGKSPTGVEVSSKSDDPDNTDDNDSDGDGNPDDVTVTLLGGQTGILVTKTDTFNDENGNGIYESGESITYNFAVTNSGNVTLSGITIADPLVSVNGGPIVLAPQAIDSTTFTATYTLIQDDVDAGRLVNQATVTGEDSGGTVVTSLSDDPDNIEDVDSDNDGNPDDPTVTLFAAKANIALEKIAEYVDANEDGMVNVGDVINYKFNVENNGSVTLLNILIDDPMVPVAGGPIDLAPGASDATTFTATYEITQEDINNGEVINTATAFGSTPDGTEVSDQSDDPTDPTKTDEDGDGDYEDITLFTIEQVPQISLSMAGTYSDDNGNGIADIGDSIRYVFEVRNTGNLDLFEITLADERIIITGGPIDLKVDERNTSSFTAVYALTPEDLQAGFVENTATVRGRSFNGIWVTDVSDDPKNPEDVDVNGDGDSDDITVNLLNVADDGIIIYNVLTPNGDGKNDYFKIGGIEAFPDNTLRIFNRWGVEVFGVDGYGKPNVPNFTGESSGRTTIRQTKQLPVGTYYYVLDYGKTGKPMKKKAGYLYINR